MAWQMGWKGLLGEVRAVRALRVAEAEPKSWQAKCSSGYEQARPR